MLLYSLAITTSPRDAERVQSWADHFWRTRRRFFSLFAGWIFVVSLANVLVLQQPLFVRFRLGQLAAFSVAVVAASTDSVWFHRLLAAVTVVGALVFMTSTFVDPAPLVD